MCRDIAGAETSNSLPRAPDAFLYFPYSLMNTIAKYVNDTVSPQPFVSPIIDAPM